MQLNYYAKLDLENTYVFKKKKVRDSCCLWVSTLAHSLPNVIIINR